jgi:FolB domain-containing protein
MMTIPSGWVETKTFGPLFLLLGHERMLARCRRSIATLAKCCGRVTATDVDETFSTGTDRIRIEQLDVYTRVGVTDSERSRPQRITLSLTVWPRVAFTTLDDDVTRTVDYSDLCRSAREFVESRSVKLIETLVSEVAAHLLKEFPLRAIEIELRKYVLPDAKHVAVIIRREATS